MKTNLLEKKIKQTKETSKTINAAQAHKLLLNKQAVLIDVREHFEFLQEHIEGALNYPIGNLDANVIKKKAKGKVLIIQCLTGDRSTIACKRLHSKFEGQTKLTLQGGINAWRKAGYSVIAKKKNNTISLFRQIQISAGLFVLTGCLLGFTFSNAFFAIPLFVGCGLVFAGASGWCGMGILLMKMPWNK